MNKKLDDLLTDSIILPSEVEKYNDYCSYQLKTNLATLGRQCYNLALDDVKKKIEKMKKYAKESKMEFIDDGYNQNAFAEDCRIISFDKLLEHIDKLKIHLL